jgi:predicted nucleic acid-binding protein
MIVVSDTSAISNLLAIDQIDLLKAIYGDVFITPAVQRELYRIDSNKKLLTSCDWIKVMAPNNQVMILQLLDDLDLGEAESIALAVEQHASYLIIDELKGRKIADHYGVRVVGILGVLIKAKLIGEILHVKPCIDALRENGFRLNDHLVVDVLKRLGEI